MKENQMSGYTKLRRNLTADQAAQKGFSLIEVMMAMAIAFIVLAAIYSVHAGLTRSYTTQNVAADIQQTIRAGIDFMVEDMMMAGFDPINSSGAGIEAASSTSIRFSLDRNMNGIIDETDDERITYSYIGANRRIDQCLHEGTASASWENYIDKVTNLNFIYLDSDGNNLGDPVPNDSLADIRTIIIAMTVQEPAGRAGMIDRTYATQVKCRNLGL